MKFDKFIELYFKDCAVRLKATTMRTKRYIVNLKILPYFGKKKMCDITPANIREWQNELLDLDYTDTYLRTINNQLTAIFNHAVKVYGLQSNPCHKIGSIGKKNAKEMKFYTRDQFRLVIDKMMNKQLSYIIFMTFYWTGIRSGELLALKMNDIDLEKKTLRIDETYSRIDGVDIVTIPKTDASNRVIDLPDFLVADLKDYISRLYDVKPEQKLFPVTKHYLKRELDRAAEEAGVERIRIHDLRHSHVALLIDMNVPVLAISKRIGHEDIQTTLNMYGHLYPDKQKEVANQLNDKYQEEF